MHFTVQGAFITAIPSIYHPHDLQHRHLQSFFSPRERRDRDLLYRTFCDEAEIVAVASQWSKRDVETQFALAPEKVRVVPWAPPVAAYPTPSEENLASARSKFGLPEAFLFYPAQTWPHKNHIGLLEAIALLRDHNGIRVKLVCSGHQNSFFPTIQKRIRQLSLEEDVRFVGFVTPLELQSLYSLCRAVVVPTRFEAGSFPLYEAFYLGAPTASSTVTSLPEQTGDASLHFDPDSHAEMATAISRLWNDADLRATLSAKGKQRIRQYTWVQTARAFRDLYREVALSAAESTLEAAVTGTVSR